MNEKTAVYISHILENIKKIEELTLSINNYTSYSNIENENVRLACERCLTIIGEAANRIKKSEKQDLLTNTKAIIGFRNLLIHAYDGVDDVMVWNIIKNHLPKLKSEANALVKN
jgi:uncharacterized protein with HEPN domain